MLHSRKSIGWCTHFLQIHVAEKLLFQDENFKYIWRYWGANLSINQPSHKNGFTLTPSTCSRLTVNHDELSELRSIQLPLNVGRAERFGVFRFLSVDDVLSVADGVDRSCNDRRDEGVLHGWIVVGNYGFDVERRFSGQHDVETDRNEEPFRHLIDSVCFLQCVWHWPYWRHTGSCNTVLNGSQVQAQSQIKYKFIEGLFVFRQICKIRL